MTFKLQFQLKKRSHLNSALCKRIAVCRDVLLNEA
jgi:hypothetical protein